MRRMDMKITRVVSTLTSTAALLGLVACTESGAPANNNVPDNNDNTSTPVDGGVVDSGVEPDAGMFTSPYPNGLPIGTAPASRADTAFSVDPETGLLYVFFGDTAAAQRCNFVQDFTAEGFFLDTKINQWVPIETTSAPPTRSRAGGMWDATNKRMIIFGGRFRTMPGTPYQLFNDVWAYTPETNSWESITPAGDSPSPRNSFVQAQVGNQMILFGGNESTNGAVTDCSNDTWSFDVTTGQWSRIGQNGTPPPDRCFSVATADEANRKVYVYGGQASGDVVFAQILGDLWELDLDTDTWSQVQVSGPQPSPRFLPGLGYNPAKNELIMFAGHDSTALGVTNELWTFDLSNNTWSKRNTADQLNRDITDFCNPPVDFAVADLDTPERRQSFLFQIIGNKAYIYGGKTDCGISNDTWMLDLDTYQWTEINPSFTGMTCERSGQDCSLPNAQYCG